MIADEARRLTGADMSAVFLLQGGHLVIHVVSGCPRANTLNFSIPLEGSIGILAAQTGRAWIVEDLNAPGQAGRPEGAVSGVGELIQNLDIRSFIVAPLASAGGLLGTIAVAGKRPGLGHAAARRLEMLAPGAVIALENARLYAQAQQTADLLGRQRAIEEHQRLARELHDAVIQTLFSVSLIAEVLPSLWKRNPQEGQARLDELRRLTRGALAEMRGLLDQSPLPGSADTGRFLEKEH
jgi:two-component system nitrate/nitrite sensor histidine kinase NarX